MTESILISKIQDLIDSQSPRVNRKGAAKYCGLGREKFNQLVVLRLVKAHTDDFGREFFLKDELLTYLRSR